MTDSTLAVCASHSPLISTVDGGEGGVRFLAAIEEVRGRIKEFDPEVVVFFGPDHARALQNLVPAFTVVTSASGYGDWGTPTDPYDVPGELAAELAAGLIDRGFDAAVGGDLHIDHGFGQTFVQLFDRLDAIPVIPVVVNCARPPQPTLPRVIEFGRAVGNLLRESDKRVLFLGSGGLSHTPPSMSAEVRKLPETEREAVSRRTVEHAAGLIRPEWDQGFLEKLAASDWSALGSIGNTELDSVGSGTHEIRTWLAAWAAANPDRGVTTYAAVPGWITGMGVIHSDLAPVRAPAEHHTRTI
jgi:2,3-dihydroxyphenylpropionate 1,2-dioxygenase